MTITTTIVYTEISEQKTEAKYGPAGCFGSHNCLHNVNDRNRNDGQSNPNQSGQLLREMSHIIFWPHINPGEGVLNRIEKTVNMFNTIPPFKDMFTLNSAYGIQVDLRVNPADKIFSGFMCIRDNLYGHGNRLSVLDDPTLPLEEGQRLGRILLALSLSGVACDMFGRLNYSEASETSREATHTYIPSNASALALYALVDAPQEVVSDIWAQGVFGSENNRNGYTRNGSSAVRQIANQRGYGDYYRAMSSWLYAWSTGAGRHYSADLQRPATALNVQMIKERIQARTRNLANDKAAIRGVLVTIFDELRDYYQV